MIIQSDPMARPRAMPVRAIGSTIFAAAFYSALGYYFDFIFLIGVAFVAFAIMLPVAYADTSDRIAVRLLLALIGAALGVLALWTVWYGLEFGWPALVELSKAHPMQVLERIVSLSNQITYTTTSEHGETNHGTMMTKAIWLVETAVFGLVPLIGAVLGPKTAQRVRCYGAAKTAARNAGRPRP